MGLSLVALSLGIEAKFQCQAADRSIFQQTLDALQFLVRSIVRCWSGIWPRGSGTTPSPLPPPRLVQLVAGLELSH